MSEVVTPSRVFGRLVLLGAAVLALAVAAGGWYGWLWYATPAPPDIPTDGLDPDVASAVRTARDVVRQNGRSGPAWGELGQVLLAHEFYDISDRCFAQAERLDPNEARWPYYQGLNRRASNPDEALPFLRRAVGLCDRRDRGNDAPRLLLAETLLQTGAYPEAEEELNRVLSWDADNPRVHYDLGVLAEARQDDESAERQFTAAARSPFARRKSCSALAAIRRRQGDAAGAAEYDRRAAAPPEDPPWNDPYVGDYLRLEAGRRGRFQQVEDLEAAGRLPEALPIVLGLAEDASDGRAQVAAGTALYKLGRLEEAERYFRAAIGRNGEQAEANYGLAVTLYAEGEKLATPARFAESLSCADQALKLNPDHAMAYVYRGKALKALGRRGEAIDSLREAVLRRPELADTHLELAAALEEDGRREDAIAEYRRAGEVAAPEDPRPSAALERLHAAGDGPK